MNKKITVTVDGKKVITESGTFLSEIVNGEKPCGGHGRCGRCRVKAKGKLSEITIQEKNLLSDEERQNSIRLSCLTQVLGACEITTFQQNDITQILTEGLFPETEIEPIFKKFGIAIDIGTTTVAAKIYNIKGEALKSASRLNPQQEWGADVVSRIEASLSGKAEELSNAIRQTLDSMIAELADSLNISSSDIDGVVITGNTVMLSLLVNESVEPFSHAPFDVKRLFDEELYAKKIGLNSLKDDTCIYVPSCISAFVGADTVCAILATELCSNENNMLADIGTNGEIALWHNGKLKVCSTAAGPAFEGVGIKMGMRGSTGAIDKVELVNGSFFAHVLGAVEAKGICGSGLVDAVACMLDNETLDESGYLEDDKILIKDSVYLYPEDIRMLQLAKSAICAGIMTLMETAGIKASDVNKLYVAGGFGSYLNAKNASRIGLLPNVLSSKLNAVGNAALSGAALLLLNKKLRESVRELVKKATVVELASNPVFSEKYMMSMLLSEV